MKEKLGRLAHKFGYTFILSVIFFATKLLFNLKVTGKENIPSNKDDLVITSTHSSYWDPPIIGMTFGPWQEVHFIAREGLLKNPIFSLPVRTYSTTINRDDFGKKDLIKMLKAFKRKGPICVFPEGTTSKGSPPKTGTVRLAEKTNRRFLPLKIEYSRSPTRFPFFFAPVELTIGAPIDFDELKPHPADREAENGSEPGKDNVDYQELSLNLMNHIRKL
ncbi:MAG: lysophospholipid acyltransferase family protein [Candidatus Bipolaricaulia bacterium]